MKKITAILFTVFIGTLSYQALAQKTTTAKGAKPAKPTEAPKPVVEESPVLMVIDGNPITKSEFEKVYRKNNQKEGAYDMADLREYVQLYINYKLKVREAESLKLDTGITFINELKGYRKQLAQPYMTDKEVTEALLQEAYNRMLKDVRASHILINVAPDALPKDTLEAYNRAMKIRDMVIKGAPFEKVARDSSNDPSAAENGGDLGFFTGMQMVYPFETAAYNTKPGQISMPVRTKFGYHIIKVHDVRDAQGEVRVAHIMVKAGMDATDSARTAAKLKIDEIYAKLKAGDKFEDLVVKFSEDKGSAKNQGLLPPFGTGRMVPEFEKASFELKNDGDYSAPVKTSYGWHIIKRIEHKPVPSFDQKKNELKTQIARDSRSEVSKNSMIARIKKEYGFTETSKNKEELIMKLDSSLVKGEWTADKANGMNKSVFKFAGKDFTQQDFAVFISNHQTKKQTGNAQQIGMQMYDQFVNETCLNHEEAMLDSKYPEFKALMQEYRDGILLFDLTDQKVWSKAVKDTVGLKEYYEKNKTKYMHPQRCHAVIYTCANEKIANKARKLIQKGKAMVEITAELNKESQLNVNTKTSKFVKGENDIIDGIEWKVGITPNANKNSSVVFVHVMEVLEPMPKNIDEAKGVITADYQSQLEKMWIDELRAKYPYKVNNDVLDSFSGK
ncbi:MAG: peptidylprolyl isomerase [Bacteroidota bacterium]